MEQKDLLQLAKMAMKSGKDAATNFSFQNETFTSNEINDALRKELSALACDYATYRENKNTIFRLVEETIDEVLPQKVLESYGQFADIQTYAQGEKAVFKVNITNASRRRAKNFITRVGLAGVYEVFKLDGKAIEIPTEAYGGAAQIGIEEFLDGRIQFSDILDIVMEGLDEAVYREIAKALVASVDSLPAANKVTAANFDEKMMDRLVQVADAYGKASIFCTYEFAATMVPSDGWVSNEMKDTKWNVGYLGNYKGHQVIVLPQSFEDETNAVKVIDPAYAWVIPAGASKPVKVAFEGQALVREEENQDWSREIQTYKKFGVGTMITNDICVYKNTSLTINAI